MCLETRCFIFLWVKLSHFDETTLTKKKKKSEKSFITPTIGKLSQYAFVGEF